MKTTKLVIGIISIVLFFLISMQSCAVGVGNSLAENGEVSGTAGVMLAFCMLIAGIVGIATRKGIGGGFVAGGFYLFGGLMGIANYGSYSDLKIWSVLSFIFAAIFIIGTIRTKKNNPDDKE
ncbi:MAG: hypothetical protein IJA10_03430 [Lachnospiraceae bacterium]|nr:hypothetical protein [Lachnospiraceae bacterium]